MSENRETAEMSTDDTAARPAEPEHAHEDDTVERAVSALFAVGRRWARYGLGVGHAALESSAFTLRTTAELLGDISDRLASEEDAEDERAA